MNEQEKEPFSPAITFVRPSENGGQDYIQLIFRSVAALKDMVSETSKLPDDKYTGDPVNDLFAIEDWGAITGIRRFKNFDELFNGKARSSPVPPPPTEDVPVPTAPPQTRRLNPPPKSGKKVPVPAPAAINQALDQLDNGW